MLSKQLQDQIEQEAAHEARMHFHPQYSRDQNTACRINYKNGAQKYAALYETALARAEDTTEKIIDLMDFVAEAKGHISDEEIISQVRKSLPVLLETLTPKTGEDALHKEP